MMGRQDLLSDEYVARATIFSHLITLDLHAYKWLDHMQKMKRNNSELSVKPWPSIMTSPRELKNPTN
jgi:hypothetical protein